MRIFISLPAQTLELFDDYGMVLRRYAVSTAINGPGELNGSHKTPRGRHLIRAKIGTGAASGTVFVARRPTGETWSPELAAEHPGRDWILTRILWLSGCEPGRNRLGEVDTMRRYIYIHGSPDSAPMGRPGSIGCVRMNNNDIAELFDLVPNLTPVLIGDFHTAKGDWIRYGKIALPVREDVFVSEQGVPIELERDEFDAEAVHAVALDAHGRCIGTGRLFLDSPSVGRIGRMAVLADWRRCGVGAALLFRLLEAAAKQGLAALVLSAQVDAIPFYRRFGFVEEGDQYLDADIPHVTMRRALMLPAQSERRSGPRSQRPRRGSKSFR
jgi:predicted GNAT family N-acyltransferase